MKTYTVRATYEKLPLQREITFLTIVSTSKKAAEKLAKDTLTKYHRAVKIMDIQQTA